MRTVLVTGVGGPLGISVLKALTSSSLKLRVLGTDVDARSVGLFLVDEAFTLPRADTAPVDFCRQLLEIVRAAGASVVFPCSELEMFALARADVLQDFRRLGCEVCVPPLRVLEAVTDKYLLARALRAAGLPAPESTIPGADDFDDFVSRHGFPLLLKARFDSGSRNVHRIETHEQLDFFSRHVKRPVVQELLLPDDQEYTVGVFVGPAGRGEGTIILKRNLAAGLTYKADLCQDDEISSVCVAAVRHFGILGPANVQLRKTANGPSIFEINPRCSSTTVVRAHFGFNEPELFIRAFLDGEHVQPSANAATGTVLRLWDEIYVSPDDTANLEQAGRSEKMQFDYGVRVDDFRSR